MACIKPVFISDRKKRFLEQAKVTPYSKDELKSLLEYLRSRYWEIDDLPVWVAPWRLDKKRYNFIINREMLQTTLEEYLDKGYVLESEMEETDDLWVYEYPDEDTARINFFQYLLIYFPKVFVFLTQVPDRQVPLYIHKPFIRAFAIWRMKLA